MDGVTGVTVTRHVTSNVGTQQTAILRTGATVPSGSGITSGAQVQVKTEYESGGGSGMSAYGTVTRIANGIVYQIAEYAV